MGCQKRDKLPAAEAKKQLPPPHSVLPVPRICRFLLLPRLRVATARKKPQRGADADADAAFRAENLLLAASCCGFGNQEVAAEAPTPPSRCQEPAEQEVAAEAPAPPSRCQEPGIPAASSAVGAKNQPPPPHAAAGDGAFIIHLRLRIKSGAEPLATATSSGWHDASSPSSSFCGRQAIIARCWSQEADIADFFRDEHGRLLLGIGSFDGAPFTAACQ
ncbi:hypothetical protein OsI_04760 [Oryza sativa Indica Group]|uniref:Uncharacterized protein n=1 Tax=Oryza sativa subsp. indica TaxID=39946 RepID=B8A7T7_ORYSI|nr:hypothetical protein OsI_04760 [Oryza sativa Indica Group]